MMRAARPHQPGTAAAVPIHPRRRTRRVRKLPLHRRAAEANHRDERCSILESTMPAFEASRNFPNRIAAVFRPLMPYLTVGLIVMLLLWLAAAAKALPHRLPLHAAAVDGDLQQLRQVLARGGNVNAPDDTGLTPLHCAAQSGNVDVVRLLLSQGARLDARDNIGETPLYPALRSGGEPVVRLLLEGGASPRSANVLGLTPLHIAAMAGPIANVRQLLEHGADISARDKKGFTAMERARRAGQTEIVSLLEGPHPPPARGRNERLLAILAD
jgi:hypothetical protein